MDYSKLVGVIIEKYGTRGAFAQAMGLDPSALSRRLSGETEWSGTELAKAIDLLGLDPERLHQYFFTPLVEKSQ